MENYQNTKKENIVLADMHGNGVYFDPKILGAYRDILKKQIFQTNSSKEVK
ncbi:MAG: hypothetical protein KJO51_07935 [Gramella sp.]|nr:hypothetical protein [Christiangramia sp.]